MTELRASASVDIAGTVSWVYALEPAGTGVRLTESWEFLPAGLARFRERYGDDADAQIRDREQDARSGIPATLQAVKKAVEA